MSLRLKLGLPLLIIGLVIAAIGVGLLTIWAPPPIVNVSTTLENKAPVTIIDPSVRSVTDGDLDLKLKADGDTKGLVLAIGRTDDVKAWVGKAANNTVTGVQDKKLQSDFHTGEPTVPNPRGSDLWIQEIDGDTTLDYRYQNMPAGQWSLVVASDGTAPAPSAVELSYVNKEKAPWGLPLIILGGIVAILGLALMLLLGRKPGKKDDQSVSPDEGTRAWEKVHTGPLTKINTGNINTGEANTDSASVSPEDAKVRPDAAEPKSEANAKGTEDRSTDNRRATGLSGQTKDSDGNASNGSSASKTSAPEQSIDAPRATEGTASGTPVATPPSGPSTPVTPAEPTAPPVAPPASAPAPVPGTPAPVSARGLRSPNLPGPSTPTSSDSTSTPANPGNSNPGNPKGLGSAREVLRQRWSRIIGVGLGAAILIFPSATLAQAAESDSPSAQATVSPSASASASAAPADAYPIITDLQMKRILDSVQQVAQQADSQKNSKVLDERFGGYAIGMRQANYAVESKLDGAIPLSPISATALLSYAVPLAKTDEDSWPRSFVAITKGDNNAVPQILLLKQDDPRANYKVIEAVPMVPAAVFPRPDFASVGPNGLDPATADGLKMSPDEAIKRVGDLLSDPAGGQKDSFEESPWTDEIEKDLAVRTKGAKDSSGKDVFTVKASHMTPGGETYAYRSADGGAVVLSYLNVSLVTTPLNDATVTIPKSYQQILGTDSTKSPLEEFSGESLALYIPPAASNDKVKIVGATQERARIQILNDGAAQ